MQQVTLFYLLHAALLLSLRHLNACKRLSFFIDLYVIHFLRRFASMTPLLSSLCLYVDNVALPAFAAAAIDGYLLPLRADGSKPATVGFKPASAGLLLWARAGTAGRTRTMRAVPITWKFRDDKACCRRRREVVFVVADSRDNQCRSVCQRQTRHQLERVRYVQH